MDSVVALDYFEAVFDTQKEYLSDNRTALLTDVGELDSSTAAFHRIAAESSRDVRTLPLNEMVATSFADLSQAVNNENDAKVKSALHFIGKWMLPNITPLPSTSSKNQHGQLDTISTFGCSSAEERFVDTLEQTRVGEHCGQKRISVYHDAEGTPIALRKASGESSALLLEPVKIDSIEIPVGMIVAVGRKMNVGQTGQYTHSIDGKVVTVASYEIDESTGLLMMPTRLSAWAYNDRLDRASFAISGHAGPSGNTFVYDAEQGADVTNYTIDDFRSVAQQVMALAA